MCELSFMTFVDQTLNVRFLPTKIHMHNSTVQALDQMQALQKNAQNCKHFHYDDDLITKNVITRNGMISPKRSNNPLAMENLKKYYIDHYEMLFQHFLTNFISQFFRYCLVYHYLQPVVVITQPC